MTAGRVERLKLDLAGATLEAYDSGGPGPVVCAAHPVDRYTQATARRLSDITGVRTICVNPRGVGASTGGEWSTLASIVVDLERVRQGLGLDAWSFWGISGGGWIGQAYALESGAALRCLVLESVCCCYRARVADAECLMNPRHPTWSNRLPASEWAAAERSAATPSARSESEWRSIDGVGSVLLQCGQATLVVPRGLDTPVMLRAQLKFLEIDFRDRLHAVSAPTLLIAGSEDPVAPMQHVVELHRRIEGSRLVVADHAGHNPTLQGHEASIAALRELLAQRGAV